MPTRSAPFPPPTSTTVWKGAKSYVAARTIAVIRVNSAIAASKLAAVSGSSAISANGSVAPRLRNAGSPVRTQYSRSFQDSWHVWPGEEPHRRPRAARDVRPEALAELGQPEATFLVLGEDPDAHEQAEHPPQRVSVRVGRRRQIVGRPRSIRQMVGEVEVRGQRQRPGDVVPDRQAIELDLWRETRFGVGRHTSKLERCELDQ